MTISDTLHLVVEAEPFLSVCRAWRARYDEAQNTAYAFCKKHGSDGFFPDIGGDLYAITTQPSVPEGWSIKRSKRVAARDKLVPAKGPKGDAIRAEIDALPKHPRHHEIAAAMSHPCQLSYEYEGGSGCGVMGYAFDPVKLGWAGETLIILAPNADYYVQQKREDHPGCTITQGEWTIPDGLRLITKAQKDLIYAQEAVASEGRAE